jgi:predicted DNA-binding transcriptional regulator YafY
VARNVAEINWHKTQRTKLNDDGSLEFQVTVSGLQEISWWIMGYGDQAEVLEPAKLREMIFQRAQKLVELYRPGS